MIESLAAGPQLRERERGSRGRVRSLEEVDAGRDERCQGIAGDTAEAEHDARRFGIEELAQVIRIGREDGRRDGAELAAGFIPHDPLAPGGAEGRAEIAASAAASEEGVRDEAPAETLRLIGPGEHIPHAAGIAHPHVLQNAQDFHGMNTRMAPETTIHSTVDQKAKTKAPMAVER